MASVKAPRGQHVVQVVLDFWTDGIAPEGRDYIVPKVAWDFGMVNMAHGITAIDPIPLNSFDDFPEAIRAAVAKAGITLQEPASRRRRV